MGEDYPERRKKEDTIKPKRDDIKREDLQRGDIQRGDILRGVKKRFIQLLIIY